MTRRANEQPSTTTTKRKGKLRRTLTAFVVILVALAAGLVVVVAFLGLRVAERVVAGVVTNTANESIQGSVSLQTVSLSWRGPQRVEGVRLLDPDGNLVADVSLSASTSVLGLIRGSRDLGELRVTGEINATRVAGATTLSVQDALTPRAAPPTDPSDPSEPTEARPPVSPSRLPHDFAATLNLTGLRITYTDPDPAPGAARSASVVFDDSKAVFRVGQPLTVDVLAGVTVDGHTGSIEIASVVDGLTRADGLISPELATANISVDVDAPAGLLDAIPQIAAFLDRSAAAGGASDRVTLAVRVAGDSKKFDASVEGDAPGASLRLGSSIVVTPYPRVSLTEPLVASVTLTPGAAQALGLEEHGFTLNAPTAVRLRVDAFDSPISTDIDSILDGLGAVRGSLETGEIRGALREGAAGRLVAVTTTPVRIAIDAPTVSGPVTLAASTSATYDGHPAGDLNVDVRIEGADALVRERATNDGASPVRISGEARLVGLATSIARPFLEGTGVDVAADVGPRLDVTLVATTDDAAAGASGGVPPSRLALRVQSENIEASGDVLIDANAIRTTGDGVTLTARSVGPLMARLLEASGVRVSGAPMVSVTVRDASASLSRGGGLSLADARGFAGVSVGAFDVTLEGADAPVRVQATEANATLSPGASPIVHARATGVFEGASFPLTLDATLPGVDAQDTMDLLRRGALPTAQARIDDAPLTLARVLGMGDFVGLAQAGVGETVSLTLDLEARPDVVGAARWAVTAGATRMQAESSGLIEPARVVFNGASVETTLTPNAATLAIERFAPDLTPRPALAHDVRATARLGPMELRRNDDGSLDTAGAAPVAFSLEAHDATSVQDALRIDDKPVGVSLTGARASGTYALFGDKALVVSAQTGVRGLLESQEAPLAQVAARASVRGDGAMEEASVRLSGVDAERLDRLLNMPELTALSLGSPFTIDATLTPEAGGAPQRARVRVEAPRLSMESAATLRDGVLRLESPIDAQWTMDPRWAARYLTKADEGSPPVMTFVEPTTFRVRVPKLSVATGDAPLRPDVFEAEARLETDSMTIRTSAGETVRMEGVSVAATGGGASLRNALTFVMDVQSVGGARPNAADGQTRITGRISDFADDRGALALSDARIDTLDANGELPSALLDALANQRGRLAELLGPTVRSAIEARGLSRRGGTLSAGMNSPRAEGRLEGRVEEGVFVASAPATFVLHEITPAFSKMTLDFLFPFVTNLEKQREDGPARLTLTNVRAPIETTVDSDNDGAPDALDMRLLNGDARLELGQVRFETSSLLGRVLKPAGIRSSGKTLDKFPPVEVKVRDGVATYERTRVPLGEFAVESRGTVDLHRQRMDLIIYVPLFALVDEIAGAFGRVPGLDRATMVPMRLRGKFGDVTPQPAPELLLEELGTNLPKDIIDKTVGPLLDDLLKGGGKKKK